MFYKEIETERLLLKNISIDDRDFILSQFSDTTVTKYLFDAEPITNLKEADEIINMYIKPEPRLCHRWILILKSSGKKIGTCGFHCYNPQKHCVEIGYDLKQEYWGQGFMTEAIINILFFAKKNMNVTRVDAHIYTENTKSVSLVEKLNFVYEGKTEMYLFRGQEYLHYIYSLNIPITK